MCVCVCVCVCLCWMLGVLMAYCWLVAECVCVSVVSWMLGVLDGVLLVGSRVLFVAYQAGRNCCASRGADFVCFFPSILILFVSFLQIAESGDGGMVATHTPRKHRKAICFFVAAWLLCVFVVCVCVCVCVCVGQEFRCWRTITHTCKSDTIVASVVKR